MGDMKPRLVAALVALAGCGGIAVVDPYEVSFAEPCPEPAKLDRCEEDRPGNVALCYADAPGPAPMVGLDSAWPAPGSGCAAPDEQGNELEQTAEGPLWSWWCCAPSE